jgi:hypothetical protein
MPQQEPNLDFGTPVIFFDSHPDEQESYLYSYWSSLKSTLRTAWTGDVPKFHHPGTLRVIWWTHDGSQGMKDFELHDYILVREKFDVLLDLEDVRRVVVMGYSGQNPYVRNQGMAGWGERKGQLEKEKEKMEEEARRAREAKEREEAKWREERGLNTDLKKGPAFNPGVGSSKEGMDNAKEGRVGTILDIEDIIEQSERAEEERLRELEEKTFKENDGLLSGEMV